MNAGAPFRPTHAYIPGRTPRHPDGAFDTLRDTARPGDGAETLARSPAFVAGLHYLDTGYFWEAHDVLEPVWMALPDDSAERRFVQALIQLANGRLKLVMDRPRAALRLAALAHGLMADSLGRDRVMGVDPEQVASWIGALEDQARNAL